MNTQDYRDLVTTEDCRWCGASLPRQIDSYPHDGGFKVDDQQGKQWLSIHCKCGYDWSLWKLGVKEPA